MVLRLLTRVPTPARGGSRGRRRNNVAFSVAKGPPSIAILRSGFLSGLSNVCFVPRGIEMPKAAALDIPRYRGLEISSGVISRWPLGIAR